MKQELAYIDPNALFDVQVKRIHEYKRQIFERVAYYQCYNRHKAGTSEKDWTPRVFILAGKAASTTVRQKQID